MWRLFHRDLHREFLKLKQNFPCHDDLTLEVGRKGLEGLDSRGIYLTAKESGNARPTIVMREGRWDCWNTLLLMHEFCHAIQDYEGRLVPSPTTTESAKQSIVKSYELEVEARKFMVETYAKWYSPTYEPYWHLAITSYRDYSLFGYLDGLVIDTPEIDWSEVWSHLIRTGCVPEDTNNRLLELRGVDTSMVPRISVAKPAIYNYLDAKQTLVDKAAPPLCTHQSHHNDEAAEAGGSRATRLHSQRQKGRQQMWRLFHRDLYRGFLWLKQRFPCYDDLVLKVSRKGLEGSDIRGMYLAARDSDNAKPTIVMREGRWSCRNLLTLMHEFCHAIQDHEGRLVPRPMITESAKQFIVKSHELEIEAWKFAIETYAKWYRPTYAPYWHYAIADYRDCSLLGYLDGLAMYTPEIDWREVWSHLIRTGSVPEDTNNRLLELRGVDTSMIPRISVAKPAVYNYPEARLDVVLF